MTRLAVALVLSFAASVTAAPTCLGPVPYVKKADSPFDLSNVGVNFFFDDFEGPTRAAGVTPSAGSLIGPMQSGIVDSVDEDDGTIDGSGLQGHSWFSGDGSTGIRWTFDAQALGGLPTAAGIVWTDGAGEVSFEAVAADGTTVLCASGPVSEPGVFPDSSSNGETAEDRFFGIYEAGGISSIVLSNSGGGIELDHLQFGAVGLAGTSTTTTTTSPAPTTTTEPGACGSEATFASILCRLDALVADTGNASDLGRLKQGIVNAVKKARKQAGKAASAGAGKVARTQLKKAAKSLDTFRHKLDSNNAKRLIPQPTREGFRSRAADIHDDVNTLRGTL